MEYDDGSVFNPKELVIGSIKDNKEYYWYIGYSYIETMLAAEIYIVSLSVV